MRRAAWTLAALCLALGSASLLSCKAGPRREPAQVGITNLPTFDVLIYPLAGAGAYLVSNAGTQVQIFYLRGTETTALKNVALDDDGTIYPLAEGSAYLTGRRGDKSVVYFLSETTAKEIHEVDQLSSAAAKANTAGFLWATLQAEHARATHTAREDAKAQDDAASEAREDQ